MEEQSKQNLQDIFSELAEGYRTDPVINAIQKLMKVSDVINQFPQSEKEHLKKSLMIKTREETKKLKIKYSKHP